MSFCAIWSQSAASRPPAAPSALVRLCAIHSAADHGAQAVPGSPPTSAPGVCRADPGGS